ncbi:MAG: SGNH/GDSL hydrolase family protein [Promethearchaeota archaeon]
MKNIELGWKSLLQKDFVYGIPNFFNGEFLNEKKGSWFSKKDEKNILKGKIQRFPEKLIKKLPYLKSRSICTAGVRVEFMTSAEKMEINAIFPKIGRMNNMSSIAQRSIDILVDGKVWTLVYPYESKFSNKFFLPKDKKMHRITLVFPNYAPCILKKIKLYRCNEDFPTKRSVPFAKDGKPIIFYGSSITQGGCTSRPSLAYTYQICERLGVNYVNLGISGAGRGENEMAEYISSFKHATLFVLDWGANLLHPKFKNLLEQRYQSFWEKIHSENPKTPILFIGLQNYFHELVDPLAAIYIENKRKFIENQVLENCMKKILKEKLSLFDYIDGESLINLSELEMTVDGVHPNDLGHRKYAEVMEFKIVELLIEKNGLS